MKLNWKKIDKIVEILAMLGAGGVMIFGVEKNNLRWFAFGILGIILIINKKDSQLSRTKESITKTN